MKGPMTAPPPTDVIRTALTGWYAKSSIKLDLLGNAFTQLDALEAENARLHTENANLRERCETAGEVELDATNRRLHFLLFGECPAYPHSNRACNTMICDCNSPWAEHSTGELLTAATLYTKDEVTTAVRNAVAWAISRLPLSDEPAAPAEGVTDA